MALKYVEHKDSIKVVDLKLEYVQVSQFEVNLKQFLKFPDNH